MSKDVTPDTVDGVSPHKVDKPATKRNTGRMDTPRPPTAPTWTTLKDAGKAVNRSTRTLRRAIHDGRLVGTKGDGPSDPWMVRLDDVQALWGDGPVKAPSTDSTLALQLADFAQLLSEAKNAEADARERAARAEAESEHLRERLAELRARRWWQKRH